MWPHLLPFSTLALAQRSPCFLKTPCTLPFQPLCFGCSLCLKPSSPKYLLSPSAPSCCPLLQYNLQYNLPWLLYSSAHLLPQAQFCCSSLPRDILSVCPLLKVSRDFLLCPQYLGRGQHIAGWQWILVKWVRKWGRPEESRPEVSGWLADSDWCSEHPASPRAYRSHQVTVLSLFNTSVPWPLSIPANRLSSD